MTKDKAPNEATCLSNCDFDQLSESDSSYYSTVRDLKSNDNFTISTIPKGQSKTAYECCQCGQKFSKWVGQCTACRSWNSLNQVILKAHSNGYNTIDDQSFKKAKLIEVSNQADSDRLKCNLKEFDDLMGGGLMRGSVNLLGGEPGCGKSTFTLQIAEGFAALGLKVLMVSAEESVNQVKARACRLKLVSENLWITPETNVERISEETLGFCPDILIVDSIQTVDHSQVQSFPGSPPQVRAVMFELINTAKQTGATIVIVGQVTKDGYLAGPKLLEHMVDSVVMFSGERNNPIRTLSVLKNRFGSCDNIVSLEMTNDGLKSLGDLRHYYIESDLNQSMVGTCFTPISEARQIHVAEIQTLVSKNAGFNFKRVTEGYESGRLLILIAILEKYCNLKFSDRDIFLTVSKNHKVMDKAADLSVCASLISSLLNKPILKGLAFIGEVSLNGLIKPTASIDRRLNELEKLRFDQAAGNFNSKNLELAPKDITLHSINQILDLPKFFR